MCVLLLRRAACAISACMSTTARLRAAGALERAVVGHDGRAVAIAGAGLPGYAREHATEVRAPGRIPPREVAVELARAIEHVPEVGSFSCSCQFLFKLVPCKVPVNSFN